MFTRYPWWGGGNRGPCDFSVSPSPFGLDFGTLDFGLGLDNIYLTFLNVIKLTFSLQYVSTSALRLLNVLLGST